LEKELSAAMRAINKQGGSLRVPLGENSKWSEALPFATAASVDLLVNIFGMDQPGAR
jgi:hypothetical protein